METRHLDRSKLEGLHRFKGELIEFTLQSKADVYVMSLEDVCEMSDIKDSKWVADNMDLFALEAISLKFHKALRSGGFKSVAFFPRISYGEEEKELVAEVGEGFSQLNWSEFEKEVEPYICSFSYKEFSQCMKFGSVYSRAAYFQLKRHKREGIWEASLEEFKRLLEIPDSYEMSEIKQRVLNQIRRELTSHFEKLEIIEMREGKRKAVTSIGIRFVPQLEDAVLEESFEVVYE